MQIRRLRLQNFRQHADTVLTFEGGLTGIVGPNGAGKTTLLEAIAWAIYGTDAVRGTRDTIRRRGAPPRSRVEVELEFDLGPHRYRVVRSLQNAELFQDGDAAPIANSLGTVTEKLIRLLGMNRDEFFSTYFTGQKELAIMAQMTAPERAQFLSRVLGYEKLRTAQQRLKDRRKVAQLALEGREAELPDPDRLRAEEAEAGERLKAAEAAAARLEALQQQAEGALQALRPETERWEALQQQVFSLEGDVKVAEHSATAARAQFSELDRELAKALGDKAKLDELAPRLAPYAGLRAERDRLDREQASADGRRQTETRAAEIRRQIARLDARLAELPPADDAERTVVALGEVQAALLVAAQEAEARRTAWVREKQDAETQRKNLLAQHEDLREQRRRLEAAGAEGDCPTCARPLGNEYAHVMGLLDRQLEEVEFQGKYYRQRIEQLQQEPAEVAEATRERDRLEQEVGKLTGLAARRTSEAAERARLDTERGALATQEAQLLAAAASAPTSYDAARHEAVRAQIALLEPEAMTAERLRASAERALEMVTRAATAEQELSLLENRARTLREQLVGLGWSMEGFEAVRRRSREAEETAREAALGRARAAGDLTAALGYRAEVTRRIEDRERRRLEVQRMADEVALLQELDRALGDLRTDLNSALRPELSEIASGFLSELTAGRYTDLELDEDYLATVVDDGEAKPVISGGEEDIANLALRLAISQRIADRAGQPLSLLVLDEIFGSLDEERRVAVVDLLRHLADRFPQVILITHVEAVRDGFDRVIRLTYDVEQRVARAALESRDAAA